MREKKLVTSSDDGFARLPLNQGRKKIVERSIAKFRALGLPIDRNPRFIELLDLWIAGEIEMAEVAEALRSRRRNAVQPASKTPSRSDAERGVDDGPLEEELLKELENVIGFQEPD